MSGDRELIYADLVQAVELRSPELAALILRYLEQPDPAPGEAELPAAPGSPRPAVPEDSWDLPRLQGAVADWSLRGKNATERKQARRAAWEATLASPLAPPRLALGRLLLALYEAGDEPARSALLEVLLQAPLVWGLWQGAKRIYKLAEERHDAAMLGVLAYRFDSARPPAGAEVGPATLAYLRRRAFRYLRQLGRALPESYPHFAVEVLRHYPADFTFGRSWVASSIWGHRELKGRGRNHLAGPPRELSQRYLDEAWKVSPAPLLLLLTTCLNDQVADFAVRGLERDFPEALARPDPAWLARLGRRPLPRLHELAAARLRAAPELHPERYPELGLEEMVLGLVESASAEARRFGLEYARAYPNRVPVATLATWAGNGAAEVRELAAARLQALDPRAVGLDLWLGLLRARESAALAAERLRAHFAPTALDVARYVALATGTREQRRFVAEWFTHAKARVPAAFHQAVVDDPRADRGAKQEALTRLGSGYTGQEISMAWARRAFLEELSRPAVSAWLTAGLFRGDELDVPWLQGLALRPEHRALALEVLGNADRVSPARLGLHWLLSLARHPDPALPSFAEAYLVAHLAPADLGPTEAQGLDALWALASAGREPEAVRRMAGAYLLAHHPDVAAARTHGVAPRLAHAHYPRARLEPLFEAPEADVRALATALGLHELVRWGDPRLLYDLAASPHREPRQLAQRLLLAAGEGSAQPPLEWLDPARCFQLAESAQKATRELGVSLIRRHYGRLGGTERLAWLMESPDREVRLFAVRLLWEKHRPAPPPPGFRPKQRAADEALEERAPTAARADALLAFLRTTLFGLPPGRMERREAPGADRPLPASVAKRRLIEILRDLALEDQDFAALLAPLLADFVGSAAKGEWQASLAALARLRAAHPGLGITLTRRTG